MASIGALQDSPAVAGGRFGWFVAWKHWDPGYSHYALHGRVVWSLFADDFEWGTTATWSAVSP